MNKEEFLAELRSGLAGLPRDDIDERVSFYAEIIDDRIEEGLSEAEAVAGLGPVGEIVSQIIADTPFTKLVLEKVSSKRALRAWEIVLLVLGFPLWFPLLVAAGAVLLALYVVVWALIVTIFAVELAFLASVIGEFVAAVVALAKGSVLAAAAALGLALFCAGVSYFLFFGCIKAAKGLLKLTKKAALGMKARFIRNKENDR